MGVRLLPRALVKTIDLGKLHEDGKVIAVREEDLDKAVDAEGYLSRVAFGVWFTR